MLDLALRRQSRPAARKRHELPGAGQILFHPTGIGEAEICYGIGHFASKAGELADNPLLTIVDGLESLRPHGELTLCHVVQKIELAAI